MAITMAKAAGYAFAGVFMPEAVPIISMIDSLATSDAAKFGKRFANILDKDRVIKGMNLESGFTKTFSYNFGVTLPTEALQTYVKYVDQLKGYDLENEKIRIKLVDDFLNRGKTYLFQKNGKSSVAVSRIQSHNFYSAVRLKEMDDMGLVPYIEHARSSNEFKVNGNESSQKMIQKAIDDVNQEKTTGDDKVSSEMCKYLLGEKSDLSLVDMTVDQLETYKEVLEKLPISTDQNAKHGYEEYQLYLNSKYSGGAQ